MKRCRTANRSRERLPLEKACSMTERPACHALAFEDRPQVMAGPFVRDQPLLESLPTTASTTMAPMTEAIQPAVWPGS